MSQSYNQQDMEALELAVAQIDYLFQEGVVFTPDEEEKILTLGTELQNIYTSIQIMKNYRKGVNL